jgi:hypothetical protein
MKRFLSSLAVVAALLFAFCFPSILLSHGASAQAKDRAASERTTSIDLELAGQQSATVKYQLTDEQGGGVLKYSNGSAVRRMNAQIVLDYTAIDGRRDEQDRKVYAIRVDRPAELGGALYLDNVPFDPSRSPGTIDFIKAGDLVN